MSQEWASEWYGEMRHSLIPQYHRMHENGYFAGRSLYKYVDEISETVRASKAKTLLDYGSGKGCQYVEGRVHELWGSIMPTLYDPAVEQIARRPVGQFDGVICTDVMEHVPEEEVAETLADICGYAREWCFLAISCRPAKKCFPDGRNVHVTIRDEPWWLDVISESFSAVHDINHGIYLTSLSTSKPMAHVSFERHDDNGKPSRPALAKKL